METTFYVLDEYNQPIMGAIVKVLEKVSGVITELTTSELGKAAIETKHGGRYIAEVIMIPEGYKCSFCHEGFNAYVKEIVFTVSGGSPPVTDCPAYDLLEGEVICMERDLWKCENGEMVKIEENSPECKEVEPKGPACPIACVYMGTPLIDQLGPIQEFRDEVLKMSRAGLIFVSLYYGKLSPHLSPLLEKSETLRRVGRILVRGLLWRLRK